MTYLCWCWSWSPDWGSVLQVSLKFLSFHSFHNLTLLLENSITYIKKIVFFSSWLLIFIFGNTTSQCTLAFWFGWDFPVGSEDKASACNAGDLGLIPGLGRSPGEGNGNPFQYSCLKNPMDRGAWWAIVHGVAKSWTWLSNFTHTPKSKNS